MKRIKWILEIEEMKGIQGTILYLSCYRIITFSYNL